MKKVLSGIMVLCLLLFLSGCTKNKSTITESGNVADDLYVGEYKCIDDEIQGEITIINTGYRYCIQIELYNMLTIDAFGNVENGTLVYSGADENGNKIFGNIEEYGDGYPIRVEFYGEGLFDELEFEKK